MSDLFSAYKDGRAEDLKPGKKTPWRHKEELLKRGDEIKFEAWTDLQYTIADILNFKSLEEGDEIIEKMSPEFCRAVVFCLRIKRKSVAKRDIRATRKGDFSGKRSISLFDSIEDRTMKVEEDATIKWYSVPGTNGRESIFVWTRGKEEKSVIVNFDDYEDDHSFEDIESLLKRDWDEFKKKPGVR